MDYQVYEPASNGIVLPPEPAKATSNPVAVAIIILLCGIVVGIAARQISSAMEKEANAARAQVEEAARKAQEAEETVTFEAACENGQAKIFQVFYGNTETVIKIIRTIGSHKAVSVAPPGKPNSFYIQDKQTASFRNLKEARPQDYPNAAGIDLIFDRFDSRNFDLIEGTDTSESAWHFRNVQVVQGSINAPPSPAAKTPSAAPAPTPNSGAFVFKATHKIVTNDGSKLRVRSNPSTSGDVITSLDNGSLVQVLETGASFIDTDGYRGNWMRIATPNGVAGWCFGAYLRPL